MKTKRYIYFQDDNMLIGWLEEFPDYRTQGENLEELEENLKDIYSDIMSDKIPCVRRVGKIQIA